MDVATMLYIKPDYLHTAVTMIERPFWLERVFKAWQEVPIAWLSGAALRQDDARPEPRRGSGALH